MGILTSHDNPDGLLLTLGSDLRRNDEPVGPFRRWIRAFAGMTTLTVCYWPWVPTFVGMTSLSARFGAGFELSLE